MSYVYRFCATCGTQRVARGYRCSVCGDTVRHASRSRVSGVESTGGLRPFATGWRKFGPSDIAVSVSRQNPA